jgi:hypothetical protein
MMCRPPTSCSRLSGALQQGCSTALLVSTHQPRRHIISSLFACPCLACCCSEQLPDIPEPPTDEAQQQRQVASLAESAFFLYERQLQRERLPELTIQVPPQALNASTQQHNGAAGRAAKGSSSIAAKHELTVRVEYGSGQGGSAGLHFWGRYAATDNQAS